MPNFRKSRKNTDNNKSKKHLRCRRKDQNNYESRNRDSVRKKELPKKDRKQSQDDASRS